MQYQEAIHFIENLQKFGDEPGLTRMSKMLEKLGNPHVGLRYVHVTGTNGKGSTSATTASILLAAGYKVGLYTSPHLYQYNERIKINNVDISNDDFVRYIKIIKQLLIENPDIKPALFEVITVMSFMYFQEKNTDIVVMEVGIGGRYDSTNIIQSDVAIITNIALEHTYLLGNTKEEITLQKAGIIKQNSVVITADEDEKVLKIIENEAKKHNSAFLTLDYDKILIHYQSENGQVFDFGSYKNLEISLLGSHQLSNVSLAILAANSLVKNGFNKVDENAIRLGLKNVKWPLRLEIVHHQPTILIDVVHNPHGVNTISKTIEELFFDREKILVLGCSYDKPFAEMAQKLSKLANTIIITKANYHGTEVEQIAECLDKKNKEIYLAQNVETAMKKAKELANENALIMVLGGLYLGAEAKQFIGNIFDTNSIEI